MNTKFVMAAVGIFALAAGLYIGSMGQKEPLQSQLKTATLLPQGLKTIPDVTFTDQHGKAFSKQHFMGQWQLLFFGYTHCPDVCPMTMTLSNSVVEQLKAQSPSEDLQVVFISVDPERDTPDHLRKYMDFFNPNFVGLNSSESSLEALTKHLGVVYQRIENEQSPADYHMDHSANLLLIAPSGDIIALFTPPFESQAIADDISLIRANFTEEHAQ